jgi:hypothetical protein
MCSQEIGRKRKRRCVFPEVDADICINCEARGAECFEQKRGHVQAAELDKRSRLRDKVVELQKTVQLLKSKESRALNSETSLATATPTSQSAHSVTTSSSLSPPTRVNHFQTSIDPIDYRVNNHRGNTVPPQDLDPVTSLFDNAFVRVDIGTLYAIGLIVC